MIVRNSCLFVCYAHSIILIPGGSGIPEVKAYLNGSNIPHVFTLISLITKIIGVISSISSSLVVGADPMVHTGAMIGKKKKHHHTNVDY